MNIYRESRLCPFERLKFLLQLHAGCSHHVMNRVTQTEEATWLLCFFFCDSDVKHERHHTDGGGVWPTASRSKAGFLGRFSSRKNSSITAIQHWASSRGRSTSRCLHLYGQYTSRWKEVSCLLLEGGALVGRIRTSSASFVPSLSTLSKTPGSLKFVITCHILLSW